MRENMRGSKVRRCLTAFACLCQVVSVFGLSITPAVDVFTGHPFTLECKVTRQPGDRSPLIWYRYVGQDMSRVYASRNCTLSIPVLSVAPAGLSGGCQHVNGEEVYTVTIQNVTEDTGRGRWICQYAGRSVNVTLDIQVLSVNGLSITAPGDVVAGRPFTLECKITRPTGDTSVLIWYRTVNQDISRIYASRKCTSSIQVPPSSPAGLSGGCQLVNGEEFYTVTIENVTEDTGRGRWRCEHNGRRVYVKLDVKVVVTLVNIKDPPEAALAGIPISFTCVTSASKPNACIRAYIRSSANVRELDQHDCKQDSSSVQTTTRTLTFTASAEENGAELYCNASNSVTDTPVRSEVYTLSVLYTPRITCRQSQVTVFQGERVKIVCDVTANPVARIYLIKNGNRVNHTFTSMQDPTRRDATLSTSEIEITKEMSSTIYKIEATNSAGSSWAEVEITVIESRYIPKNLKVISCTHKKATLIWASGLEDSWVEYYKLEYKGHGESWKEELVRNPGRVKLVETTLNGLQSGVLYEFRLQPDSHIPLSEYATTECTIEKESNTPDTGLSKTAMFGVGFVAGILVLAVFGVCVICWLRRKEKLKFIKGHRAENQQTRDQVMSVVQGSDVEESIDPEIPSTGHYEDLDTSTNPGSHYEVLTDRISSSPGTPGNNVYENSTVL